MPECKHHWVLDGAGATAECRECGACRTFGGAGKGRSSGLRPMRDAVPSLESVFALQATVHEELGWGQYTHLRGQPIASLTI